MEQFVTEAAVNLGTDLAKLVIKGTATAVARKVSSIKNEKNIEDVRKFYDEIINELIQEKDDAIRIAQSYKYELERIYISDEDIEHLHNTISRILGILKKMSKEPENDESLSTKFDMSEQIKELINKDTLKTMQLLGFNYKAAIGEPLTNLCANAISSFANKHVENPQISQSSNMPRQKKKL